MKKVVVTGYKPTELGIYNADDPRIFYIQATIKKRLTALIEEGLEWVLISGQMGTELWAAQVVADLRDSYDVRLAILPPFLNQEKRWPEEVQLLYEEMTMLADYYQPIYNKEYEGPFQFKRKDRFLIEHSDGCLVLYDPETPGSPEYFLNHAQHYHDKGGYPVYYVTAMDLEDTVEEIKMADPDYWTQ
ncbi:SLOG family protein [Thalassobacillus sp. CUG 92003]|uniref:SLOG family protein n=1 Tax=Thalassobacillus sp. CUG 92003 TaxID=2736641 RepID=UPI0015E79C38|nr:DUF1273 domain-containing protein [Thalassobacillus sp. CUG 92003]